MLIIKCKGVIIHQKSETCEFIHAGNWGDSELIEHQKFHKSLENADYNWLGFDASHPFGKFSGRDGKRI
ncbi:MAG: hypothetical protein ACW9W3_04245 [Candidatus Nitrosopumilus sp. bin_68KS]